MKLNALNLWFWGAALLLLVAGCGSQAALSGVAPTSQAAAPVLTAAGRLELLSPSNYLGPVSKFRLTGFDQAGQVVFGPSEVDPANKLEIFAPLTMTSLQILLVSADRIVGGLSIPATVVPNTLTSLRLPNFVALGNDLTTGDFDSDIGPIEPSDRAAFSTTSKRWFTAGQLDVLLDFDLTRPGSVGLERSDPGVYLVRVGGRYLLDYLLTVDNMDFWLRLEDASRRSLPQAATSGRGSGRFVVSLQQIVDLQAGSSVRLFAQARTPGGYVERGEFSAIRIGTPVSPPPP
ncbi:hypothetical protein IV102_11955 [bacterium]|nr:hypothetical protein [bacterium]